LRIRRRVPGGHSEQGPKLEADIIFTEGTKPGSNDDQNDPPPQASARARVFARDDARLRESLGSLALLEMGEGQRGLETMLQHVAALATKAVPGADGAGVTVLEDGLEDTIVGSVDFVREVDAVQYRLRDGPCITAADTGHTVTSGSLGSDGIFPQFGKLAAGLGVHSVLSLPLRSSEAILGSINVYAHAEHAFDDHAIELGELFAVPAAISVLNAQMLAQARRLSSYLHSAARTRAVIDQALGIIMSRSGCTAPQALSKLQEMSQLENGNLNTVAQRLLDGALLKTHASPPYL
jgi:ANTAR domain/GAF domain